MSVRLIVNRLLVLAALPQAPQSEQFAGAEQAATWQPDASQPQAAAPEPSATEAQPEGGPRQGGTVVAAHTSEPGSLNPAITTAFNTHFSLAWQLR